MTIALSHSRLSDFNECALRFKLKYLDKAFPQEDASKSPHLVRGGNVHKALENYVVKKRSGQASIPPSSLPEVESTKPLIDNLFALYDDVMPEAQLAVNDKWEQVEWFAPDAYYRAIIDAIAQSETTALIIDYKTGKIRDYAGYGGQLHLTAAMVMSVFPQYQEVAASYLYVDHKKSYMVKFQKEERPALVQFFDKESVKVNSEKAWSAKPNDNCGYCQATKAQCKHSRKL